MRNLCFVSVLAVLIASPAGASGADGPLSVVQQWLAAFNSADKAAVTAICTHEAAVIDDFPPHEWHGAGACGRWFADFGALSKAQSITNARIEIDAPSHIESNANFAYLVIPARLSFKLKDKPVQDRGIMTVSLRNGPTGWRISGWVWADQ
jgi:ketosteroid isomerase-like protein